MHHMVRVKNYISELYLRIIAIFAMKTIVHSSYFKAMDGWMLYINCMDQLGNILYEPAPCVNHSIWKKGQIRYRVC
jgi:hypothetical protein